MNKMQLDLKLQELELIYNREVRKVKQAYALANCEWGVGDMIETLEGKFKVISFGFSERRIQGSKQEVPTMMFSARKLNKDNSIKANCVPKIILQEDIISGVRFNNPKRNTNED